MKHFKRNQKVQESFCNASKTLPRQRIRRFIEKVPGLRRPRKLDCWTSNTSIFLLKDPALDHITKSRYFICKP